MKEIIAVIHYENYVPAAFVRLLVPIEHVKSYVVTDEFVYGSPLKAQAIVKHLNEQIYSKPIWK
ncbi:hypothetical protein NCCP2050_00050 [Planococcus sp. NCCP-2050]|nr:hypothetical protein NCCP2050_00050 [Planococcus sp. NCCP-2050]